MGVMRWWYSGIVATVLATASAHAQQLFWENGTFRVPFPSPGGFALVDTGERFGTWRVVGQAGNVMWTTGAYVHDGFNFTGPGGTSVNWVNLAGISRTATGIAHIAVPTTVGSSYTLTFEVGNLVDDAGVYGSSSTVNIYENSTFVMAATNTNGAGSHTENWKQFTVKFLADAPYTTIAFINGDPANDMNCGVGNTVFAPTPAGAVSTAIAPTGTGDRK